VNLRRVRMVAWVVAVGLAGCSHQEFGPSAPEPAGGLVPAAPVGVVTVTTAADDGPGSFRAAIEAANADPSIGFVRFERGIGTVELESPVTFTGGQDLGIEGAGATLEGGGVPCVCAIFVVEGGGDLTLRDLAIENAPGNGATIDVSAAATGAVSVRLHSVAIRNSGLHGLHVDDQTGGDTGADSGAGIDLVVVFSEISGNGFRAGFSDFDGIRVDEGGHGDLHATIQRSRFVGNAGDGIELDERGAGNAYADARHSRFDDNGDQPQDPDDLEDGFDVDEADAGSIHVRILGSTASDNEDEGIDLDEEGPGDIRLELTRVEATDNLDENVSLTEDEETGAGGGIEVRIARLEATGSRDGDGIKLEEFGPGDLAATIVRSTIATNDDDGIQVEQVVPGEGLLRLLRVDLFGNGDDPVNADGVDVIRIP